MDYDNWTELKNIFARVNYGDPVLFNNKEYHIENIYFYEGRYKGELESWAEIVAQKNGKYVYLTCDYGSWSEARKSQFSLTHDEIKQILIGNNIVLGRKKVQVLEAIDVKVKGSIAASQYRPNYIFKLIDIKLKRPGYHDRFLSVEIDPKTFEYETFNTRNISRSEAETILSPLKNKLPIKRITTPYVEGHDSDGEPDFEIKGPMDVVILIFFFFIYLVAEGYMELGCDRSDSCFKHVKNKDGSMRKESVSCDTPGSQRYRRRSYGK